MKSLLTVKPKWIHVDNTAASIFDKKKCTVTLSALALASMA